VARDAARLQADLASLQGRLERATRWTEDLLAQIPAARRHEVEHEGAEEGPRVQPPAS